MWKEGGMLKVFKACVVFATILSLTGCAYTGIVPMDKDTYMVGRRSLQFGCGAPVGVKALMYRKANEFCAKQNKKVETINCEMKNGVPFSPGSVSLKFRCVSDNDGKIILVGKGLGIEGQEVKSQSGDVTDSLESIDKADEIRKYKKLMDEKIITKEEFEQKKKQLLGL